MGLVLRILTLFVLIATPALASYDPGAGPGGGVSSITGSAPVSCTAGTTPVCSLVISTCAADGVHALTSPAGTTLGCTALTVGTGTVTSTAFATNIPGVSITGSPVTTTGTLTATLATQSANRFLAGPTSGSAALPTWRLITGADMPLPTSTTLGGVQSCAGTTNQFITQLGTDGSCAKAQPNYTDLAGTQPSSIVSGTPITVTTDVTLTMPGVNKSFIQRLNFAANNKVITIPSGTWVGQQVHVLMCQDGAGNHPWTVVAGPGTTLRGSFGTPDLSPGLCQLCGFGYETSTTEAFMTNPGCTVAE